MSAPQRRKLIGGSHRGAIAGRHDSLIGCPILQPDTLDVTVASLDTPELVAPRQHIWMRSALPWMRLDDDLPRYREREPVSP